MKRTAVLLVTLAAVVGLAAACPPKAENNQLPPAGLAGAPDKAAPLALPGAGMPVAAPSGTTDPKTTLPPGHPPIPGASADASGSGAMPAGHPSMPTAMPGAGDTAEDAVTLSGAVLETMDVPEYTYMRVKTGADPNGTWVAVTKTPVAVGDVVTVNQSLEMTNFFSKTLNRSFPKLVMGTLVGAPKKP